MMQNWGKGLLMGGFLGVLAGAAGFYWLAVHDRGAEPQISAPVRPGGDVLAVVHGKPILREAWKLSVEGVSPDQSRRLLAAEARRQAVLGIALEAGYGERPEVRKRYEESVVALYLREELQSRLATVRLPQRELDAYIVDHPLDEPMPRRRIAIIRQQLSESTSIDDATQSLLAAKQAAQALELPTAHFGPVAMTYSDHMGTRARGGVLGYFGPEHSEYDLVPAAVHEAAWRLEAPGAISDVVEADGSVYLVRYVDQHISPGKDPANQIARIRERLLAEKRNAVRTAFFDEIEALAAVEIAEEWRAEEVVPQPPSPPPSPVAQTPSLSEPRS